MSDITSYDELIKLKELMDMGIISESEFVEKKRLILGLDNQVVSDNLTKNNNEISDDSELISCPGCGRKVSKKAIACPGCGHPVLETVLEIEAEEQEKERQRIIEQIKNSDEYKSLSLKQKFLIGENEIAYTKNSIRCTKAEYDLKYTLLELHDDISEYCTGFDFFNGAGSTIESYYEIAEVQSYKITSHVFEKLSNQYYYMESKVHEFAGDYDWDDDEERIRYEFGEIDYRALLSKRIEKIAYKFVDSIGDALEEYNNAKRVVEEYRGPIDGTYSSTLSGLLIGKIQGTLVNSAAAAINEGWNRNNIGKKEKQYYEKYIEKLAKAVKEVIEYAMCEAEKIANNMLNNLVDLMLEKYVISEYECFEIDAKIKDKGYSVIDCISSKRAEIEKCVYEQLKVNPFRSRIYLLWAINSRYSENEIKDKIIPIIEFMDMRDEVWTAVNSDAFFAVPGQKKINTDMDQGLYQQIINSYKDFANAFKSPELLMQVSIYRDEVINVFKKAEERRKKEEEERIAKEKADEIERKTKSRDAEFFYGANHKNCKNRIFFERFCAIAAYLEISYGDLVKDELNPKMNVVARKYRFNDLERVAMGIVSDDNIDVFITDYHLIFGFECFNVSEVKEIGWFESTEFGDRLVVILSNDSKKKVKKNNWTQNGNVCVYGPDKYITDYPKYVSAINIALECFHEKEYKRVLHWNSVLCGNCNDLNIIDNIDINSKCNKCDNSYIDENGSIHLIKYTYYKQYSIRTTLYEKIKELARDVYDNGIVDELDIKLDKKINVDYYQQSSDKFSFEQCIEFMKYNRAILLYKEISGISNEYLINKFDWEADDVVNKINKILKNLHCKNSSGEYYLYFYEKETLIISNLYVYLFDRKWPIAEVKEIFAIGGGEHKYYLNTQKLRFRLFSIDCRNVHNVNFYLNVEKIFRNLNYAVQMSYATEYVSSYKKSKGICNWCNRASVQKGLGLSYKCSSCGKSVSSDGLFTIYNGNYDRKILLYGESIASNYSMLSKEEIKQIALSNDEIKIQSVFSKKPSDQNSKMKSTSINQEKNQILCPKCKKKVLNNSKFCNYCGQPMVETKKCCNCGKVIKITAKFCCYCGENAIKQF